MCSQKADYTRNWSKNIKFSSEEVLFPSTVAEVQAIVNDPSYVHLKAYGTRHCFNDIADTATAGESSSGPLDHSGGRGRAAHICLENLTDVSIDTLGTGGRGLAATVTFQAGVNFTRLMEVVDGEGFAIENLPSLPHISVIGGIITGTHGAGYAHPILAKNCVGLSIVQADGTLRTYRRGEVDDFDRYLLSFGALGVIVSATMTLVPAFCVAKGVYTDLPFGTFFENFDQIMHRGGGDFISLFTDWREPRMTSVWVGRKYAPDRGEEPPEIPGTFYGARHIPGERLHPIPGQDPLACIAVGCGSWTGKITHFLPDHPPSSNGDEVQLEYFVPYHLFPRAFAELYRVRETFRHLVQITELRMMCRDGIPMSQARDGPVIGIHFTCHKMPAVELNEVFARVEGVLAPYGVKVHFGKWFTLGGDAFEEMYGDDIVELRKLITRHDPLSRFTNDYIERCIFNRRPRAKL